MTTNANSYANSNAASKKDFLEVSNWLPDHITMLAPKTSKVGYDISIMSTQLVGRLNLVTPYMKTWGIQDFIDPSSGISSGKYNMVLRFPNDNYGSEETTMFLEKLQKLEEKILDVAYENRVVWFGDDEITRDVIKSKYFSMLKYQKLKDANGKALKKLDFSKPPTFKIKVPYYKNKETGLEKWNCQIYDSSKRLLFPNEEDASQTPVHFVTTNSEVKCKVTCSSIWVGEKAWGVQWSLMLCFVKPKEVYNRFDVSAIDLGDDEPEEFLKPYVSAPVAPVVSTNALDSDDENEEVQEVQEEVRPSSAVTSTDSEPVPESEEVESAVASSSSTSVQPTEAKKKVARKPKA